MTTMTHLEPPWLMFPGHLPEDGFGRQTGEAYLTSFLKAWASQSDDDKIRYLDHHNAPTDWQEYLKPGGVLDWLQSSGD